MFHTARNQPDAVPVPRLRWFHVFDRKNRYNCRVVQATCMAEAIHETVLYGHLGPLGVNDKAAFEVRNLGGR